MINKVFAYPVTIEHEDSDGVVLRFRDLSGAVTGGDNRAEALAEAPDCLAEAMAAAIAAGEPLPDPSDPAPGEIMIPVPVPMAVKCALYQAMQENGVGIRELARRLGCTPSEAQRLVSPRHNSKVSSVLRAIRVAGGPELEVHTREVA